MSTVLTKPVLLDETGQAIVGKLDEIKEAIDNGGTEKYPVLIHITTMPTKTSYIAGEQLNLAGMVVKAVFSNNVEYDVTDQCTFSPANGTVLTSSDTSVTATYTWHPTGTSFTATQAITVKGIVGISVATPPTKTDYIINETLDLTGMVVHLDYDDNTYEDVTADCTYVPANGATLDDDTLTAVAISYYEPTLATTLTTAQAISVIIPIYGVDWDGTATSILTRTDSAADFDDPNPYYTGMVETPSSPFDNIWPWSGMEVVEDSVAGTLVKIPKFYYKWTLEGGHIKLQVSSIPLEGYHTSPAHADRGDDQGERDFVYVGAYHCCSQDYTSKSHYMAKTNDSFGAINNALRELGSDINMWDFAMWWTISMLYLVEYADWDSQKVIGMGCGETQPSNGATDQLPYHTGTDATQRSSQGSIKYRHIEGLWSGVWDYMQGLYNKISSGVGTTKYNNIYTCQPNNYGSFGGSDSEVRIAQNTLTPNVARRISNWQEPTSAGINAGYYYALFPSAGATSASYDEYCCDAFSFSNDSSMATSSGYYGFCQGGAYGQTGLETKSMGLFYFAPIGRNSRTAFRGARLMKLPANT